MGRRITEIFPFLIPLRKNQRKIFFYLKMRFDKNKYAKSRSSERLSFMVFETRMPLINRNSGFDLQYQINKVENLRIAASKVNNVVIRPGEVFSFWQLVKGADKKTPYKDALCLVNGKIIPAKGGGLCQLSNMLFWMFLHTPMAILERHPHRVEAFPPPPGEIPVGADATVNEGWLDLKMKNETDITFQVEIIFDEDFVKGIVWANRDIGVLYEVRSQNVEYYKRNGLIFRENDIRRQVIDKKTDMVMKDELLFHNRCRIGYEIKDVYFQNEEGDQSL